VGYKESVTLQQIKTFTEMDSHEEKLQKIITEVRLRPHAVRHRFRGDSVHDVCLIRHRARSARRATWRGRRRRPFTSRRRVSTRPLHAGTDDAHARARVRVAQVEARKVMGGIEGGSGRGGSGNYAGPRGALSARSHRGRPCARTGFGSEGGRGGGGGGEDRSESEDRPRAAPAKTKEYVARRGLGTRSPVGRHRTPKATAAAAAAATKPIKGMQLSKKKKSTDDFLAALGKEEVGLPRLHTGANLRRAVPIAEARARQRWPGRHGCRWRTRRCGRGAPRQVSVRAASAARTRLRPQRPNGPARSVHVAIEEKLVCALERDGGLKRFEVKGEMKVTIMDPDEARLVIRTNGAEVRARPSWHLPSN
jgi:hypothetical protein